MHYFNASFLIILLIIESIRVQFFSLYNTLKIINSQIIGQSGLILARILYKYYFGMRDLSQGFSYPFSNNDHKVTMNSFVHSNPESECRLILYSTARLVVRQNVIDRLTENILILGKQSLAAILIISNLP